MVGAIEVREIRLFLVHEVKKTLKDIIKINIINKT